MSDLTRTKKSSLKVQNNMLFFSQGFWDIIHATKSDFKHEGKEKPTWNEKVILLLHKRTKKVTNKPSKTAPIHRLNCHAALSKYRNRFSQIQ